MNIEQAENEIISRLTNQIPPEAHLKCNWTTSQWTQKVIEIVGRLGLDLKYKVCAAGDNDFESEWLFDIVWYKNNNLGLIETPLIMECEWHSSWEQIKYDFEKLLVARADIRVMMFEGWKENIRKHRDKFIEIINSYKYSQIGDRYLFIALDWDDGVFWSESFQVN